MQLYYQLCGLHFMWRRSVSIFFVLELVWRYGNFSIFLISSIVFRVLFYTYFWFDWLIRNQGNFSIKLILTKLLMMQIRQMVRQVQLQNFKVQGGRKVIYSKYFKHWLPTVVHTIDCVCSKSWFKSWVIIFTFKCPIKVFWTWKFRIKI